MSARPAKTGQDNLAENAVTFSVIQMMNPLITPNPIAMGKSSELVTDFSNTKSLAASSNSAMHKMMPCVSGTLSTVAPYKTIRPQNAVNPGLTLSSRGLSLACKNALMRV